MTQFRTQQQFFADLLKKPANLRCADCENISPTWASLDFGVFLCSNCSGAHRSLGPTITRVRSTKLDKWQPQWFQNMLVGNHQANAYWEANIKNEKKLNAQSSTDQIKRFVVEKYMRKKWAAAGEHPLIIYKKKQRGQYVEPVQKTPQPKQQQPKIQEKKTIQVKQTQPPTKSSKMYEDLLMSFEQPKPKKHEQFIHVQSHSVSAPVQQSKTIDIEEDQFDNYVSVGQNAQEATVTTQETSKELNFNDLLRINQQKSSSQYSIYHQPQFSNQSQMHMHHQYQSYNNIPFHQNNSMMYYNQMGINKTHSMGDTNMIPQQMQQYSQYQQFPQQYMQSMQQPNHYNQGYQMNNWGFR